MLVDNLKAMLKNIGGYIFIFLDEGPLRTKLIEIWKNQINEINDPTYLEEFLSSISVNFQICYEKASDDIIMRWQCERIDTNEKFDINEISILDLEQREIEDVVSHTRKIISHRQSNLTKKEKMQTVLIKGKRGQEVETIDGMFDARNAANNLGVSIRWLTKWIPCTTWKKIYTDKEQFFIEYFWSIDLIEILTKIQNDSFRKSEKDYYFNYVTKECCYGDKRWAAELIREMIKIGRYKSRRNN